MSWADPESFLEGGGGANYWATPKVREVPEDIEDKHYAEPGKGVGRGWGGVGAGAPIAPRPLDPPLQVQHLCQG